MSSLLQNPVYTAYFADPFCFFHNGVYYAVGTGRDEADACPVTGNVVPMIKSIDLQNWQSLGHVLKQPAEEKGGCFWAPEIATDGKKFYMYYHPNGQGKGFHIRCATADAPAGPYVAVGTPLTDLAKNPFAIDAHAFQDDDGQWYMYYATDFLDFDQTTFRGTALVVDRMTSMTTLEGQPKTVMRAHHAWQIFRHNRDMYGKIADWYTLEGATVIKRFGTYYLFYSGGCYENDSYGVDYLTAPHPMGPWSEVGGKNGPQIIRSIPQKVIGPGHNSIVADGSGRDHIVYHAWNEQMTERQLWIDPLEWQGNVPSVGRFASYIAQRNAEGTSPTSSP